MEAATAACPVAVRVAVANSEIQLGDKQMSDELDGRHRDENGRISEKHGNTRVDTLREIYGENFLPGRRGDTHLETIREETGNSLSELVRDKKNRG